MKKLILTALAFLLIFNLSIFGTSTTKASALDTLKPSNTSTSLSEIISVIEDASSIAHSEYVNENSSSLTTTEKQNSALTTLEKKEIALQIQKELQIIEQENQTPEIEAYNLTSATIVNKFQANLKRANEIKATYNRMVKQSGTVSANAYRLSIFYLLVKSGGSWDLKQTLGTKTTYYFKGVKKTGEYIGNYHYGYMGKAIGFNNTVLKSAAGMYQIKSGTSEWKFISSYFDDPADQTAITNGFTDYNNGYRFSHLIA